MATTFGISKEKAETVVSGHFLKTRSPTLKYKHHTRSTLSGITDLDFAPIKPECPPNPSVEEYKQFMIAKYEYELWENSLLLAQLLEQRRAAERKKTFGVPLGQVLARDCTEIPKIVTKCVEFLENTGLETVGLFRVPGDMGEINNLRKRIDAGENVEFTTEEDVHVIAGLLKSYFRSLPEPFVPPHLDRKISEIFTTGDLSSEQILLMKIIELHEIIEELPAQNYNLLKCLVSFLRKITAQSAVNKMTIENLITCIVPTLNCTPAIVYYPLQHFEIFFT